MASVAKHTLFALISSLEEDLRNGLISNAKHELITDYPGEITRKAIEKFEKETPGEVARNLEDIVEYFDFGDAFILPSTFKDSFDTEFCTLIKSVSPILQKIAPIRNRVMHGRSLDISDLPFVADFCDAQAKSNPKFWLATKNLLAKAKENPACVLEWKIPVSTTPDRIQHNIPTPDYEETGLIGREDEIKRIIRLIKGQHPVISIVGEGGVGKTAIAVKVANELLEDETFKYDAIIWVSSKTNRIGQNEIKEIRGAITDAIGILEEVHKKISGVTSENPLQEILEYAENFKICIFLDNLETVLSQEMRKTIEELSSCCKLVITSRIGVGAYEVPVKLSGLEEKSAVRLLRVLAKERGLSNIQSAPQDLLYGYLRKMNCNPGYIKWFVSTLQTGVSPDIAIKNSETFLEFCMSNVFNHLDDGAKLILACLQTLPGERDASELSLLSGLDASTTLRSLMALLTTNMLNESMRPVLGCMKTFYQLGETSRQYLGRFSKVSEQLSKQILGRRNSMLAVLESQEQARKQYKLSYNVIRMRDKSDKTITKMLYDALAAIRDNNFESAYRILDETKLLSPENPEVHRVFAFYHVTCGNIAEAASCYNAALELSPNDARVYFWYAGLKFRYENDIDGALALLMRCDQLDPNLIDCKLEIARCHLYQKNEDACAFILNNIDLTLASNRRELNKYYDLRVDLAYRIADRLFSQRDFLEASKALANLAHEFYRVPEINLDERIRRKVTKAQYLLDRSHFGDLCDEDQRAVSNLSRDILSWGSRWTP